MNTIFLLHLFSRFVEGDFKWSLSGAICFGLGLFISKIIEPHIKQKWLRPVIAGILIALFVWVGHQLVFDPMLTGWELWWVSPIDEPMQLNIP